MTLGSARRRTIASCLFVAAVAAVAAAREAEAQEQPKTESVTTGPEYGAGGFHRAMLGSSYRALWTTPVDAARCSTSRRRAAAGSRPCGAWAASRRTAWRSRATTAAATPSAASTRTRRTSCPRSCTTPSSRSSCGTRWRRSTRRARWSPTSSSKAAGVPTVPIRLVVMPDDPGARRVPRRLRGSASAPSRSTRPPRRRSTPATRAPSRSSTTWRSTRSSPRARTTGSRVREFLRARLFDVFISDFDRHRKQWRWAKAAGRPALAPDPRGPRPGLRPLRGPARPHGRAATCRRCATFGRKYDRIFGLTYNGREQDRWLLPELPREAWHEVARGAAGGRSPTR